MPISTFFGNLSEAYGAEIDDMTHDSQGLNVLESRLAERRAELGFLVAMLESSPELVAVVFHRGLRYHSSMEMEHLLSLESDELPDWDSLTQTVELEPWTQQFAEVVLAQPAGRWFLTVVAALEYMHGRPSRRPAAADDGDDDRDDESDDDRDADTDDTEEERDARERDKAGADWLADQGFDRKD